MAEFISFGADGDLINPALVWRITRAIDTVTFHIVAEGMPAGESVQVNFVFADEAAAIAALSAFIVEVEAIKLNDIVLDMCSGITGNTDLTKGFEKSPGISVSAKLDRYANFIVGLAVAVKKRADA